MSLTPRPGIMEITPYVGGESQVAGLNRVHRLASNENPLGASPQAAEAYRALAGELHRYPDGAAAALRRAIAESEGIEAERIVCGAGSDELISLLVRAYAGPGDEVLQSRHGFLMYAIAARAAGAKPRFAPERDLKADVEALIGEVSAATRLVFLANPNNPTGSYLSGDALERLRRGLPDHVLLVLDSAYAEYVEAQDYESGRALVQAYDNVVMLRTFSKIHGLAALRLGWAYCPAAVADVLNRVRGPFNVSQAALEAGLAALADSEHVARSRRHNTAWLARMSAAFAEMGLTAYPSVGNFLLVRFEDAGTADAALADLKGRGVLVRQMGPYGLADCLRITVGTEEEVTALLEGLRAFLSGKGVA